MKSGIILLPIGLSVSNLKDIIFELNLATAAIEKMSGGNHSAFLADEESSSVLSGRPFGKVVIEKYWKIVL